MQRWYANSLRICLGLFVVAVAVTVAYDAVCVWPEEHCEGRGAWWDPKDRQCLAPVPIWRITGRTLKAYGPAISDAPPEPTAHPPRPAH
jgi:hypothetical protein